MKIINIFQLNNLNIKKFLIFIFSVQLMFWGTIGSHLIGLHIPIIRQVVCIVYLLFLPGFLLLRIFRLHNLNNIENILSSVGLSLIFIIVSGLLMTIILPKFGIYDPISLFPLTFIISSLVLVCCVICYFVSGTYSQDLFIDTESIHSTPILLLFLILLLTVFGTYLVNYFQNSMLLFIILFLLSLIVIFVGFSSKVSSEFYYISIFITALSLLYHNSLISNYLWGFDIQYEYFLANKVLLNSVWNPNIFVNSNAMLSMVIVAPILSILSDMNIMWIFKVVYPFIFSLAPLGLFCVFKKQIGEKRAFLATFFFISFSTYYTVMVALARQQIAEFFFILILLFMQKSFSPSTRILLICFGFGTIVSHYGLSYILMVLFFCVFIFQLFLPNKSDIFSKGISLNYLLFYSSCLVAWYLYTSQSSAIYSIVNIMRDILSNLHSDFLNPDFVEGLHIISNKTPSPLHEILKFIHLFTLFCISIGLLYTVITRKRNLNIKFDAQFVLMSFVFFIILIVAITVPYFASALNTDRIYQITLILLSPYFVIGGYFIFDQIFLKFNIHSQNRLSDGSSKIISVFLMFFLLFNSGWIFEFANDVPSSMSLNNSVDTPIFNEEEYTAKNWLIDVNSIEPTNNRYIYADYYRILIFANNFERRYLRYFDSLVATQNSSDSYIFISTYNLLKDKVLINYVIGTNKYKEYVSLDNFVSSKNKIYENGGAIFFI